MNQSLNQAIWNKYIAPTERKPGAFVGVEFDARAGLSERGFQEELFLEPLFYRAERLTNPAKELLAGLEHNDTLETWIIDYAEL